MDKSVVCPFYSQEEALKLHCEGYCKGTRLHLFFDCKERMKHHKKKHCNDLEGYEKCPLYPVIYKQYENYEESDYE
jgi:hypothetical protein